MNFIPLPEPIRAGIFGATVAGIVGLIIYCIKRMLWQNNPPERVSKYRWGIAIIMGAISIMLLFMLKIQPSLNSMISAAILLITAGALKQKK